MKYKIKRINDNYYINNTKIPYEIFDQELTEYRIEERESIIDNLIMWISEAGLSRTPDKELMKNDLKLLMKIDDEFVLSSISTNHYLYGNSEEFNKQCEEILTKL